MEITVGLNYGKLWAGAISHFPFKHDGSKCPAKGAKEK